MRTRNKKFSVTVEVVETYSIEVKARSAQEAFKKVVAVTNKGEDDGRFQPEFTPAKNVRLVHKEVGIPGERVGFIGHHVYASGQVVTESPMTFFDFDQSGKRVWGPR